MTLKNTFFLFMIVALLAPSLAEAQNLTQRNSPRSMQGVRPLAMGDAFVAVDGSDENALFYNPAAINDYEKKVTMQFLLPTVEFSYKSIDFFANDVKDLANDIKNLNTNPEKINRFQTFTNANKGRFEELGVRGPIATFMHPWITASLFYENRSAIALLNPTEPEFDVEALTQGGLQIGSAYGFWDKKLQVGAAAKFIYRHLIDEKITLRDVQVNDSLGDAVDFKKHGFGVGFDIGVKGKLPWKNKIWEFFDPTFAATLQDIGHTRFSGGVGQQKESFTLGLALHPDFWKFKTNLAIDFRDLDRKSDFLHKFHAGYEIMLDDISKILRSAALRVGVNQGYIATGLGLDFRFFKLNVAAYGREVGERTRQKQSFMIATQLSAGF